jgi:hypothetical protein
MLMGAKMMPLPDDPHVRFAGMLPDEERLHALDAATVVVVPSPHESLSLLALEAFAVGTPVLANARSEVLVDHCRLSNAGLYYADKEEFVEELKILMRDANLRAAMGQHGKAYVDEHYRWSIILNKYERIFTRLKTPVRDIRPPQREAPPPQQPREAQQGQSQGRDGRDRDQRRSRDNRQRRDGRGGGGRDGRRSGRPGQSRNRR